MNSPRGLPLLRPETLDETQRILYDKISHGARAAAGIRLQNDDGSLRGPFNAMLLNPPIGDLLQQLGLAVQSTSALSPSLRELVVLRVVAKRCCEPEWRAHRSRALGLGISPSEIEAVYKGVTTTFDPSTSAVLAAVDIILGHLPIPPEALDAIGGHRTVFDLLTIVAYYDLLCKFFTVFEIAD